MPRNPILTEAERKTRKAASNVRWRERRKAEIRAHVASALQGKLANVAKDASTDPEAREIAIKLHQALTNVMAKP